MEHGCHAPLRLHGEAEGKSEACDAGTKLRREEGEPLHVLLLLGS